MVEDIIIITGKINSGKSRRAQIYASRLYGKGKNPGGVITLPYWRGEKKSYYILNVMTEEARLLASEQPLVPSIKYRRFFFSTPAFDFALEAAEQARECEYLFIDEPGPLELQDRGLAPVLVQTLRNFTRSLVLVVREHIIEDVIDHFSLPREIITLYPPEKELPL